MTKEEYLEMGFSCEDADFLVDYPKLYPIASAYGLNKKYFDEIFEALEKSLWIRENTDHNLRQLHLHSIFFRLNHNKQPYDLSRYKYCTDDEIRTIFGNWNAIFANELIKIL